MSLVSSSPEHPTGSQKWPPGQHHPIRNLVERQILGPHLVDQKRGWSPAVRSEKPSGDHEAC